MLSDRDRQVLNQIETTLSFTDPRFVAAMRVGRPRPPREYRRTWAALLMILGVIGFGTVLVTGHPLAVVGLLAVAITGLFVFVSRHLDRP